jgi:hypothetical protein
MRASAVADGLPWYYAGWTAVVDLVLDYLEDPAKYHDQDLEAVDTEDVMP